MSANNNAAAASDRPEGGLLGMSMYGSSCDDDCASDYTIYSMSSSDHDNTASQSLPGQLKRSMDESGSSSNSKGQQADSGRSGGRSHANASQSGDGSINTSSGSGHKSSATVASCYSCVYQVESGLWRVQMSAPVPHER